MRWTKLKKNVEDRFVPELRNRVAVQVTRYHKAHDDEGELWLTLDGRKIYGSSFYKMVKQRSLIEAQQDGVERPSRAAIEQDLEMEGIADQFDLTKALFLSLSQSIDDMLESPHPLIRAIAILDSRCGKRRLERIDELQEHALVATMRELRHRGTA
jgi:hypothetical protein